MYNTFICAGGAMRGISAIGALADLYHRKGARFRNFYGTSVGAIVSYLLAIGYTPLEILEQLIRHPLRVVPQIRAFDPTEHGILDFDIIARRLRALSIIKLGYIPTFNQLKRRGIYFACFAFNYTENKEVKFDYVEWGEMSCIDAVQASCSLVGIFKKFIYGGDWYIDGFYSKNFPIDHAHERPGARVFAIRFETPAQQSPADNLLRIYYNAWLRLCMEKEHLLVKEHQKCCDILTITADISLWNFASEDILASFCIGYLFSRKFFSNRKNLLIK